MQIHVYPCPFCGSIPRAGNIQVYAAPTIETRPADDHSKPDVVTHTFPPPDHHLRVWCDNATVCKVLPSLRADTIEELRTGWNLRRSPNDLDMYSIPMPQYAEIKR